MKSQEGIPLRVNTPQQEQEKRLKGAAQEVARDQEAIRAEEELIIDYKAKMGRSQDFIDEAKRMLADATSEAEKKSINDAIGVEVKRIEQFIEGIETASATLAAYHDNKKDHEDNVFDKRIELRKKLH